MIPVVRAGSEARSAAAVRLPQATATASAWSRQEAEVPSTSTPSRPIGAPMRTGLERRPPRLDAARILRAALLGREQQGASASRLSDLDRLVREQRAVSAR